MASNTIIFKDQKVVCAIKKSCRARRVRLTVYCDGKVVATMPSGFSLEKIEGFILEKSDWILKKLKIFRENPRNPIFSKNSKREYLRLKSQALDLVSSKLERYNQSYGFCWNRISIRNQKTRWGSCSKKGNLSYNYKIAILPEKYADYIIVHELCHLGEFNHSRRFWDLVRKTIPNYKEIRRELKNL